MHVNYFWIFVLGIFFFMAAIIWLVSTFVDRRTAKIDTLMVRLGHSFLP